MAQAPTQAQRAAIKSQCRSDYMAHCSSITPGGAASLQCLQKNMASLAPGCQAAVRAVTGPSETKSAETKSEPKAESKPETAPAATPETKTGTNTETKTEPAPAAMTAAPATAPTANDIKNEREGKETSLDRTRRLFYVTCSRAQSSLALVAYSSDPAAVRAHVIGNAWFAADEILFEAALRAGHARPWHDGDGQAVEGTI